MAAAHLVVRARKRDVKGRVLGLGLTMLVSDMFQEHMGSLIQERCVMSVGTRDT